MTSQSRVRNPMMHCIVTRKMADSLSVSSVRDPYSFVTCFVKSIEGGIHSNLFSKRGKRQSEEVNASLTLQP